MKTIGSINFPLYSLCNYTITYSNPPMVLKIIAIIVAVAASSLYFLNPKPKILNSRPSPSF